MSSGGNPPPPPPPPLLSDGGKGGTRGEISLKGENESGCRERDREEERNGRGEYGKLLGHTETKEITEEKFLEEVTQLISSRLEKDDMDGGDGEGNVVKVVVTVPMKKAILQSGPMCGIVALAEALSILNGQKEASPEVILEEAIKMGFTKQGEMFSAAAMISLAEKFGQCSKSKICVGADKVLNTVTHLLKGYPLLVPYDADFNHSPSLRKGHAAHWAVIYGLACYIPLEKTGMITDAKYFTVLQSSPDLLIVQPVSNSAFTPSEELLQLFNYNALHVIAHQGKSFHVALWKYKNLIESNQNLKEVAPKILANRESYILHENIVDGLCDKIVMLMN